jgi:hypothetical protein
VVLPSRTAILPSTVNDTYRVACRSVTFENPDVLVVCFVRPVDFADTAELSFLFGPVSWSEWVFVKDSLGIHVLLQFADSPVLSKEGGVKSFGGFNADAAG